MKQDRIFDGLSQRFQHKIYQNDDPRGLIRLHILQDDLRHLAVQPPLSCLDAGAGLGQMTRWLAGQGHSVVMLEPSADMLAAAVMSEHATHHGQIIREQATIQDILPAIPAGCV
ncbi:MAG: methyltransferase domain-containing protein [Thiolinea sp.]